jgi:Alginate export
MLHVRAGILWACFASGLSASWDLGKDLNNSLNEHTEGQIQTVFEARSRYEYRPGQSFGFEPDLSANFVRTRFGLRYKPASWFRITAVGMDVRAPWYGTPTPTSARDPLDLHELQIEIQPDSKLGFGANVGRQAVNLGDTRLIGSPQWAYIPRMYDGARAYWRGSRFRIEGLFLSPVKITQGWNKPVLGEHVAGTYNSVSLPKKSTLELYNLHRRQNRPGGFTGAGTLLTNSYGAHFFGPLPQEFRYNIEAIGQTGHIGPLKHRASAWSLQFGKSTSLAKRPLDLSAEYKYASGGSRPDRSGTFDQLYPAAHDKLGHMDLLGWRNTRNVRALAVSNVSRSVTLNFMYNNTWLADRRDALYNLQGRPLARSASGTAGSHIGQEADIFGAYKRSGLTLGAGYGYFFIGEFVRRTTPGVSPHYAYVFQSYTF